MAGSFPQRPREARSEPLRTRNTARGRRPERGYGRRERHHLRGVRSVLQTDVNLRRIFKYHPSIHNFAPKALPMAATSESLRGRLRPPSDVWQDACPDNIPVPQAWLELDVDNVENASANLESRGYRKLVKTRKSRGAKRSLAPSHRKDSRSAYPDLQLKYSMEKSARFIQDNSSSGEISTFIRTLLAP